MISIIIPVLNEEDTIETILKKINSLDGDIEIIVVDGDSRDRTRDIASRFATIVVSRQGRARQMNKGARESSGDILWFLHSDSNINNKSIEYIEKTISNGYIGGGFSIEFFDYNTYLLRLIALLSNLRAKYLKLYYGDQGIFLRRDAFDLIGGYKEISLMEDIDLSIRIKSLGETNLLNKKIGTSSRRFKKNGVFRTIMFMHKLKILYFLGRDPEELNQMYRECR